MSQRPPILIAPQCTIDHHGLAQAFSEGCGRRCSTMNTHAAHVYCFMSVTLVDRMIVYVCDDKVSGAPGSILEHGPFGKPGLSKATEVTVKALEITESARPTR